MRMDLLNQTTETEPTKRREKPRQEITQRYGLAQKEGIKPIKGKMPRRIRKKLKKSENKHQTSPSTDLTTKRNKEAAQV
jgi:hypothetical protein